MLNEPGYENHNNVTELKRYNTIIQHETLRVALVSNVKAILNGTSCIPTDLHEHIMTRFARHLPYVTSTCQEKQSSLDGKAMNDPFGESRGVFAFADVLNQFRRLVPATTEVTVDDHQTIDLTDEKEENEKEQLVDLEKATIMEKKEDDGRMDIDVEEMNDEDEEDDGDVVPEELKCGVCFDILATPAVLECGHVFCYLCALRW